VADRSIAQVAERARDARTNQAASLPESNYNDRLFPRRAPDTLRLILVFIFREKFQMAQRTIPTVTMSKGDRVLLERQLQKAQRQAIDGELEERIRDHARDVWRLDTEQPI
jgi:hypothetical protein